MKKYLLPAFAAFLPFASYAQSAMDAVALTSQDMKGTARFMSMGGAFGALGGDLSSLSQNPGGLGVYRSNELGFTVDLNCQNSSAEVQGDKVDLSKTHFYLNNIGGVVNFKLNSPAVPMINVGFTYNKAASFDRTYRGRVGELKNSLSNYVAGVANSNGVWVEDVARKDAYYASSYPAPWITILGYDSFLIYPEVYQIQNPENPNDPNDMLTVTDWYGQWENGVSKGNGWMNVRERGGIDEYNIAIGGNVKDVFYWGMDFDIVSVDYTRESYWGENMEDAYVAGLDGVPEVTRANWDLYNYFNTHGTGFNYKLGFIVKPIQELRLGFAFHTPTWYSLKQSFYGEVNYNYGLGPVFTQIGSDGRTESFNPGFAQTNDGYDGESNFKLRTPWKLIFSAATVLGRKFILSADYEWTPIRQTKLSDSHTYDWDYDGADYYSATNGDIKNYYQSTHNFRIGAEYRIDQHWSARLGYNFCTSPVKSKTRSSKESVWTAGTQTSYSWNNSTNYICGGLGYRYKAFYADLAYVYRHQKSDFHAYSPSPEEWAPSASVAFDNHQVVLSMGVKF